VDGDIVLSYKPQYLEAGDQPVASVLKDALAHKTLLITPLQLDPLLDQTLAQLSGGQLQRVAIAAALARKADVYLLDEPSAYLDIEQRLIVSKVIKDFMLQKGKTAVVVDHDLLFIDYLSNKVMVFDGQPAQHGICHGPFTMQIGMNRFLEELNLTFRRDEETHRPRANKLGSQMDEKQKQEGMLYYL
jgi:ATP-binding cassette subfamily E protein 1